MEFAGPWGSRQAPGAEVLTEHLQARAGAWGSAECSALCKTCPCRARLLLRSFRARLGQVCAQEKGSFCVTTSAECLARPAGCVDRKV